jgi:hypothetical protein
VECHGAERVGQRLLVPAGTEPGVPSWGRGGLLVQRLLLLRLWPGQEAGRCVGAWCGHEGLRTLLSSGHEAGVHSHVSLPQVAVGWPRYVVPAVENGGGGLARRAIMASVAGAVLAVVAAAMTAIAVFVVVLGPVATGAAVAVIGRARWRLDRRGCNVGVEHRWGSRRPGTVHVNLFQEQIIPNFEEVQKWRVAPNDVAHMLEALVQPPKDVEDEDPVFNGCAEVRQTVSHGLELAVVLIDREVTLNKSTKGSTKVKSMLLTVTEKLVLDGEPEVARRAPAFPDHLVKIHQDGVVDPVEDDAIHLNPP